MIWRMFFELRRFLIRRPAMVAGWAAGLVVMWFAVLPLKSWWPNDYYGFWIVGQTSRAISSKSIYGIFGMIAVADAARATADTAPTGLERQMKRFYKVMSSTASPFHYAVIKLASTGDLKRDYHIFRRTSAVLYTIAILAFASYLRFPPWTLPLFVWCLTVPFWPFRRDVMDTNNSAAFAGAMMLVLLALRSPKLWARFLTGFAFGLLVMFKPTVMYGPPMTAFVLLLTDRRGCLAFCAGGAAAAAVAYVVPAFVLGPTAQWDRWFKHAPKSAFDGRHLTGGLLGRYFHVKTILPYKIANTTLLAICAASLFASVRRSAHRIGLEAPHRPRGFALIAACSVGMAAYLVTGLMAWGHYFTLAVPAALIAIRPRPHRKLQGLPVMLLGLAGFAMLGLHQYIRRSGMTSWGNYSPYTIAGTALVLFIVLWDVHDSGRLRTTSQPTAT